MRNTFNFFGNLIPRSSALYNLLKEESKDSDGFMYVDSELYSKRLCCSVRQLRRCLKSLSDCRLIEKDYRSLETGNRLFVKVNEFSIELKKYKNLKK